MRDHVTTTEQAFATGFQLLTWKDARGGPARRVRAWAQALERDLSGGGDLSTGQQMLVARCAVLASLCTHSEAVLLNGGSVNIGEYVSMSQTLARLLKLLGLRRAPKEVESLSAYLEANYTAQPEPAE